MAGRLDLQRRSPKIRSISINLSRLIYFMTSVAYALIDQVEDGSHQGERKQGPQKESHVA